MGVKSTPENVDQFQSFWLCVGAVHQQTGATKKMLRFAALSKFRFCFLFTKFLHVLPYHDFGILGMPYGKPNWSSTLVVDSGQHAVEESRIGTRKLKKRMCSYSYSLWNLFLQYFEALWITSVYKLRMKEHTLKQVYRSYSRQQRLNAVCSQKTARLYKVTFKLYLSGCTGCTFTSIVRFENPI